MKIVSMSVYGPDRKYWEGALDNAERMNAVYPGWTLRLYADEVAAANILSAKCDAEFDLRVYPRPKRPEAVHFPMFWRFWPASEPGVERVIFRDADSRINVREAFAVEDWIRSDAPLHVMHDHEDHRYWPMLGGMWGIKGGVIKDIEQMIVDWGRWSAMLDDMKWLAEVIWPQFKDKACVHTSVPGTPPDGWPGRPFPEHPPCDMHVGQIIEVG